MSSALSTCFLEGSPNIREAVRNAEASRIVCLRKMRKHWRQAGCPADVRRTMQTVCRRCPEVHFRIQNLLSAGDAEAFRGDKDSEGNLSGICGHVAESCGFINFAFRILSGSCPGLSGRLVLLTNGQVMSISFGNRLNKVYECYRQCV